LMSTLDTDLRGCFQRFLRELSDIALDADSTRRVSNQVHLALAEILDQTRYLAAPTASELTGLEAAELTIASRVMPGGAPFLSFDALRSGTVSFKHLVHVLEGMGIKAPADIAHMLMDRYDTDRTGRFPYAAFLSALLARHSKDVDTSHYLPHMAESLGNTMTAVTTAAERDNPIARLPRRLHHKLRLIRQKLYTHSESGHLSELFLHMDVHRDGQARAAGSRWKGHDSWSPKLPLPPHLPRCLWTKCCRRCTTTAVRLAS